jgi:hypothetical protein
VCTERSVSQEAGCSGRRWGGVAGDPPWMLWSRGWELNPATMGPDGTVLTAMPLFFSLFSIKARPSHS